MSLKEILKRRKQRRRRELLANANVCVDLQFDNEVTIEAVAVAEGEEPKLPVFTMEANSGKPMRVTGHQHPVIINMAGVRVAKTPAPILADHKNDKDSRVGHTTDVSISESGIVVKGVISATGKTAQEIQRDAKNGYPFQASVGAKITKGHVVPAGKSERVNGQSYNGPMIVADKVSIHEFTVTSVGADQSTSFSIAANMGTGEDKMKFEQYVESLNLVLADFDDDTIKVLKAAFDAQQVALKDAVITANADDDNKVDLEAIKAKLQKETSDMVSSMSAQVRAEQTRLTAFGKLEAEYDSQINDISEIRATADKDNWSADRYELELRRKARPDGRNFAIHTHEKASADVVEASLLIASGIMNESQVGELYDEKVINLAINSNNRGYSIHRLCHETLAAAGKHYQIGKYDDGFVMAVTQADRMLNAASAAGGANISTFNVSGIMGNVMHKIMLQFFTGDSNGMATLNTISSIRPLNDFRDHPMYRLTGIGEYADVKPGGEVKQISLGEESGSISASTSGAMIYLDRVHIINDDLNAFAKIPAIIGRKARMKFLKVGFATFLDNDNFYTTDRGNLIGPALVDSDGLTLAVQAFMKMKDINGDPVDVRPSVLVCPSILLVDAEQMYNDTNIMVGNQDTTATALTLVPTRNPHRGRYQPYGTSWLDTDSVATNGADNEWYLSSTEEDMKPLQVGYLNGNRTPTLERVEVPADMLGMGWRSIFDFGFARAEWRGSVKCVTDATPTSIAEAKAPVAKVPAKGKNGK